MLSSLDLITAFVLFAFVSSITPGPNNTMLLASGVNFGVRRSIPHALGISVGFMVTNVIVIATVFALVNLPSVCVWVMFGSALRSVLQKPRWLMLFNVLMAALLVISLYPLLFVESSFS